MNHKHITRLILTALILLLAVACLPARDDATTPTSIAQQPTTTTTVATPTLLPTTPTATASGTASAAATAASTGTPTPVPTDTATPPPTSTAAPPTATTTADVSIPLAIPYVMALAGLDVRGDPRPDGAIVGHMAHGQIARVAALTPDESWLLLDCPLAAPGVADHCWVPAGEPHTMPQPGATRIPTEPGASTVTIEDTMNGDQQRHYVFHAGAGQHVDIVLSSLDNNVLFHVQGLGDGVVYKHMLSGTLGWAGSVPQTQDYLLALNATGGDAAYTIVLDISTPLPPPTGPLYPVVDVQSGFLLGGSQNGVWLDAYTYNAYLQDGQRPYTLYTLEGEQGAVTGHIPGPTSPICDQPVVYLDPPLSGVSGIALVSRWDAAPRLAQDSATDAPQYREAVAAILQENGLPDPQVQIDRVLSIDLDGDAIDETLIAASRLTAGTSLPPVAAGDYALLLLRKETNGVVTTMPLALDVYPQSIELAYPWRYSVLGLLDLDGDSILEIIIAADRYEGRAVTAYQLTTAGLQQILHAACPP